MPPAGFETAFPANELPQSYTLDLAATGIGISLCLLYLNAVEVYCQAQHVYDIQQSATCFVYQISRRAQLF